MPTEGETVRPSVITRWEPCGCKTLCGDDGDIDGDGTCKGLPHVREPLVEIVLVRRRFSGEGAS